MFLGHPPSRFFFRSVTSPSSKTLGLAPDTLMKATCRLKGPPKGLSNRPETPPNEKMTRYPPVKVGFFVFFFFFSYLFLSFFLFFFFFFFFFFSSFLFFSLLFFFFSLWSPDSSPPEGTTSDFPRYPFFLDRVLEWSPFSDEPPSGLSSASLFFV